MFCALLWLAWSMQALTLQELEADPKLTPRRFASYFTDFEYELIDDTNTAPLATRVEQPLPAPVEPWHSQAVESWRSRLDDSALKPASDPISPARNGFHVDQEQRRAPVDAPGSAGRNPFI